MFIKYNISTNKSYFIFNRKNIMADNLNFSFTEREKEVIEFMKLGYSNTQIAQKMFVSTHTIKVYVTRILEKTGSCNRIQAVYKLASNGYFKQSQQENAQYLMLH